MALHLGCEIEFMSFDERPDTREFRIHDEYYPDMYEINSFHVTGDNVRELVHQLNEHVANVTAALGRYNPVYVYNKPIHRGLVFTGVHLHIQDDDHMPATTIEGVQMARKIGDAVVTNIAKRRGLSLRQIASHHIWGRYREQNTDNWRHSPRYRPVLFNSTHQTYELRIVDFDMLMADQRRKLYAVLNTAFGVLHGERKPVSSRLIRQLHQMPINLIDETGSDAKLRTFIEWCERNNYPLLFRYRRDHGHKLISTYTVRGDREGRLMLCGELFEMRNDGRFRFVPSCAPNNEQACTEAATRICEQVLVNHPSDEAHDQRPRRPRRVAHRAPPEEMPADFTQFVESATRSDPSQYTVTYVAHPAMNPSSDEDQQDVDRRQQMRASARRTFEEIVREALASTEGTDNA